MNIIDVVLICALALPIIAAVVLISLIIYGIVKKKRKIVVASSLILIIPILLTVVWFFLFPTQFPYIDSMLYGKTREEVIGIYGEPGIKEGGCIGYYIGNDNGFFGIMPSNLPQYYYIDFDENGFADDIYISGPKGG